MNKINKLPLVVALTGSSGAIYGIKLLETLKELDQRVILIVTKTALKNIELETSYTQDDILKLAEEVHDNNNFLANVASGSFLTKGMIVCPCSVKYLSSIANSYNADLVTRVADVTLKERRKLILLFRESPINLIHIKHMETITLTGGIIAPAIPFFYNNPKTLDKIIENSILRLLDLVEINHDKLIRWSM